MRQKDGAFHVDSCASSWACLAVMPISASKCASNFAKARRLRAIFIAAKTLDKRVCGASVQETPHEFERTCDCDIVFTFRLVMGLA